MSSKAPSYKTPANASASNAETQSKDKLDYMIVTEEDWNGQKDMMQSYGLRLDDQADEEDKAITVAYIQYDQRQFVDAKERKYTGNSKVDGLIRNVPLAFKPRLTALKKQANMSSNPSSTRQPSIKQESPTAEVAIKIEHSLESDPNLGHPDGRHSAAGVIESQQLTQVPQYHPEPYVRRPDSGNEYMLRTQPGLGQPTPYGTTFNPHNSNHNRALFNDAVGKPSIPLPQVYGDPSFSNMPEGTGGDNASNFDGRIAETSPFQTDGFGMIRNERRHFNRNEEAQIAAHLQQREALKADNNGVQKSTKTGRTAPMKKPSARKKSAHTAAANGSGHGRGEPFCMDSTVRPSDTFAPPQYPGNLAPTRVNESFGLALAHPSGSNTSRDIPANPGTTSQNTDSQIPGWTMGPHPSSAPFQANRTGMNPLVGAGSTSSNFPRCGDGDRNNRQQARPINHGPAFRAGVEAQRVPEEAAFAAHANRGNPARIPNQQPARHNPQAQAHNRIHPASVPEGVGIGNQGQHYQSRAQQPPNAPESFDARHTAWSEDIRQDTTVHEVEYPHGRAIITVVRAITEIKVEEETTGTRFEPYDINQGGRQG